MEKISLSGSNSFCPQPLYLYGTYKENGDPNYGLFCWCAYCATDQMKFVACIGEDKLTRDRIRAEGIFSATVVTEKLLPAADYCGTHPGYEHDKAAILPSETGEILKVPVPLDSVWTLELKVNHTLVPAPGIDSEIYVCSIVNVRADRRLADDSLSFEEKLQIVHAIVTMGCRYQRVETESLGDWGSLQK